MSTGLFADAAGVLTGRFTIPADVPAGTKLVEFDGIGGSRGVASFTGAGTITTETRRQVTTVHRWYQHRDPLAQTFTLEADRHIAGVDVIFETIGDVTKPVTVQLRETDLGFPTGVVLSETHVNPGDMVTGGGWTRVTWPPVLLDAGTEYALVLLTDDAEHAVAVAQLGKYDTHADQWITSQPYRIGVLLSSSNAVTWSAHQDLDLCFRLLAARFDPTVKETVLGTVTADQASDVIALANVERPATATELEIVLEDADGTRVVLGPDEPVALTARWSGDVTVKARLTGTEIASPVLYPGLQAVFGILQDTATYVSREIKAPGASKLTVIYESLTPGGSTVSVDAQNSADAWVPVPVDRGAPVGDGWQEVTCILDPFNASDTRVRLTLSGSVAWRPRVRNLRVVAT